MSGLRSLTRSTRGAFRDDLAPTRAIEPAVVSIPSSESVKMLSWVCEH